MTTEFTSTDHPFRDCDGYAVFSEGDAGAIHILAHRMLDENRNELGHQLLGTWLKRNTGSGSQWIHLQWHMAVFDLALGHWHAAFARYLEHIVPAVASSDDALIDAPALLWRLLLTAGKTTDLPWEPVRSRALAAMKQPCDPYVEVHNLLALAGAKDIEALDRCLQDRPIRHRSRTEALIVQFGGVVRSYAAEAYAAAASQLETVLPHLSELGGSRAQNDFFTHLHASASGMTRKGAGSPSCLKAA